MTPYCKFIFCTVTERVAAAPRPWSPATHSMDQSLRQPFTAPSHQPTDSRSVAAAVHPTLSPATHFTHQSLRQPFDPLTSHHSTLSSVAAPAVHPISPATSTLSCCTRLALQPQLNCQVHSPPKHNFSPCERRVTQSTSQHHSSCSSTTSALEV